MIFPLNPSFRQKDFQNRISPFVSEVGEDAIGNIIAHIPGDGKRIMLIAHHDVVRLMVTYIDDAGYVYVKPYGMIDPCILPASKIVIFHNNNEILGIVGSVPVHLQRGERAPFSWEDMWIDIGARDKEDALSRVEPGDYAYFDCQQESLPNGLMAAAGLDDGVGLNILASVAMQLSDSDINKDLFYVASNQEELGMRGSVSVAQAITPDVCICVDTTFTSDYPTANPKLTGDIRLNKGCVLAKGPNVDETLFDELTRIARENGVPYQVEPNPYPTGTDANYVQLFGSGVKCVVVSVPCRYLHTPYEIVSQDDVDGAIKLIVHFLREYT